MSQETQVSMNEAAPQLELSRSSSESVALSNLAAPLRLQGAHKIVLITQDRRATLQEIEELITKLGLALKDPKAPIRTEEIPDKLDLKDYLSVSMIERLNGDHSLQGHSFFGWFLGFQSFDIAKRACEYLESESLDNIIPARRTLFRITHSDPSTEAVAVAAQPTGDLAVLDSQVLAPFFADWNWPSISSFTVSNLMQILSTVACRIGGAVPFNVQEILFCDVLPTITRFWGRFPFWTRKSDAPLDGANLAEFPVTSKVPRLITQFLSSLRLKDAGAYLRSKLSASKSSFTKGAQAIQSRFDKICHLAPLPKFNKRSFIPTFPTASLIPEAILCRATGGIPCDLEFIFFCDILPKIVLPTTKLLSRSSEALKKTFTWTLDRVKDAYTSIEARAVSFSGSLSDILRPERDTIKAQKQEIRKLLSTQTVLQFENVGAKLDVLALREELKLKETRVNTLKNALNTLEARSVEIQESSLVLRKEQEATWLAQLSELEKSAKSFQATYFEGLRIHEETLAKQNAKLHSIELLGQQMRDELNARIRSQDARILELEKANSALAAEAAMATRYIACLRLKLDESQKLLQASNSAVVEHKKAVVELVKCHDRLFNTAKEMEASIQGLIKECSRLHGKCEVLKKVAGIYLDGMLGGVTLLVSGVTLWLFFYRGLDTSGFV
ncbi:hypothetical protein GALMADRAFT_255020 [Galerina marginata CBS 339.88]|uniref:Uncharacterized protein n=1 Tax=Galerina marginata (strain CBS 339.88) TaxID=685588 RepID=A0A067SGX5_GALM3|nr:hypothetical protein GALMADRAFT_255020 [Galerina marginata CBS 339.88]